jgi:hypothetical protein
MDISYYGHVQRVHWRLFTLSCRVNSDRYHGRSRSANELGTIFVYRNVLYRLINKHQWLTTSNTGSLMSALLSVENWVPLKPVLGGVKENALIHYHPCTDLIKPSLQFSYNFVVMSASERSLGFQTFILNNSRCQLSCGSWNKLPRTSLQCCYTFLVIRDHWCQHY